MTDGDSQVADSLAFFGTLTAGLSHDLKNVLATINEYSGLLDDLQLFARRGRPIAPEKIQDVCEHISGQVARGQQMLERLSRLSHSVDHDRASVEVGVLVEDLCVLCERVAGMRRVTIERRPAEQPVSRVLDPLALMHAVYLCIEEAAACGGERPVVTVSLEPSQDGSAVVVTAAGPLEPWNPDSKRHASLQALVGVLGADLTWGAGEDSGRIVLELGKGRDMV